MLESLWIDGNNDLEFRSVRDSVSGNWVNDATVTAHILDADGQLVAGSGITLTYVAGSNGAYRGTFATQDYGLVAGARYTVVVECTVPPLTVMPPIHHTVTARWYAGRD